MDYSETEELSRAEWARQVKERDGYVCRFEGCNGTEELEAHHIVPLSQDGKNTLDNGITLCRKHHREAFLRVHIPTNTEQKKRLLFDKPQKLSKSTAAKRFLQKQRLKD